MGGQNSENLNGRSLQGCCWGRWDSCLDAGLRSSWAKAEELVLQFFLVQLLVPAPKLRLQLIVFVAARTLRAPLAASVIRLETWTVPRLSTGRAGARACARYRRRVWPLVRPGWTALTSRVFEHHFQHLPALPREVLLLTKLLYHEDLIYYCLPCLDWFKFLCT